MNNSRIDTTVYWDRIPELINQLSELIHKGKYDIAEIAEELMDYQDIDAEIQFTTIKIAFLVNFIYEDEEFIDLITNAQQTRNFHFNDYLWYLRNKYPLLDIPYTEEDLRSASSSYRGYTFREYFKETKPTFYKQLERKGKLEDYIGRRVLRFNKQMMDLIDKGLSPDMARELVWEDFMSIP